MWKEIKILNMISILIVILLCFTFWIDWRLSLLLFYEIRFLLLKSKLWSIGYIISFSILLSIDFGSIFSPLFKRSNFWVDFLRQVFVCKKSVLTFLVQKHRHFGKTNVVIFIQVEKFGYCERKCLIHSWYCFPFLK